MVAARYHLRRLIDTYVRYGVRELNDIKALQALAPLTSGYRPWNSSAMRPAGLVTVLNEIFVNGRSHVVECGAGVSTLYIARLLQEHGGHVHALEHEPEWAAVLRRQLDQEGLADNATVLVAPLEATPFGWSADSHWYAQDVVAEATQWGPVELLVVDGPPGYSFALRHARYPALPCLADSLADDYAVVLDDVNRLGEQEIAQRWEREFAIRFEMKLDEGRIAVGRSRSSFTL